MVDYVTHYYSIDQEPFRSLSALPEDAAIQIMQKLADDTPYGERFKDPVNYLKHRKETEQWVRTAFIAKGGRPNDEFPIPMVLGESKWLVEVAPKQQVHGEIRIPLSVFTQYDLSFTYPDSMISRWFGLEKPPEFYQRELHGIVFSLSEILSMVDKMGMPEEDWAIKLPKSLAPYIEAQVWNHKLLFDYWKRAQS